jgi:hypothetical protein
MILFSPYTSGDESLRSRKDKGGLCPTPPAPPTPSSTCCCGDESSAVVDVKLCPEAYITMSYLMTKLKKNFPYVALTFYDASKLVNVVEKPSLCNLCDHVGKTMDVYGISHGNLRFESVASSYFSVRYNELCRQFVKMVKELEREQMTKMVKFHDM